MSGAHFNPAVTLIMSLRRQITWRDAACYAIAQLAGCCAGAVLAHAMFELPLLQAGTRVHSGAAQWLAEGVATSGLILLLLGIRDQRDASWAVAAWIGAAYWFTASTSFANPAITLARSLSDTFAGIRPADTPLFVGAQLLGAIVGLMAARYLFIARQNNAQPPR